MDDHYNVVINRKQAYVMMAALRTAYNMYAKAGELSENEKQTKERLAQSFNLITHSLNFPAELPSESSMIL
jgi:hypothetical protein